MTQTSTLAEMQAMILTLTQAVEGLTELATAPKPKASKAKAKPKAKPKAKAKGPSPFQCAKALAGLCKLSASMAEFAKMEGRYKDPEGILVSRKLVAESTLRRCSGVLKGHEAFRSTLWANWETADWSGVSEACVAHAKQAWDGVPAAKQTKAKDIAIKSMDNAKVAALIALQSVMG